MKKVRLLIILLVCALLFAACGKAPAQTQSTAPTSTVSTTDSTPSQNTDSSSDQTNNPNPYTSSNQIQSTVSSTNWKDDDTLRILAIGNSFSVDSLEYVYQIALSAGVKKVSLGNLYIPGCSLDMHAANAKKNQSAYEYFTNNNGSWSSSPDYKISNALLSQKWDFVVLQQVSGSSGVAATYAQLDYLVNYIKMLRPNTKVVWNMTWAYQQNSTHGDFVRYNNDQMTMYNAILGAAAQCVSSHKDIFTVIPTGTAIQNARTSYIGDNLTRDGYHLSLDFGRYVAGMTFVHKLTGLSVKNVKYMPAGVDDTMRKIAIESATNAVKKPTEVTNSAHTQAPNLD